MRSAHCPICGYTKEDAAIHGDHWRCKGTIPGLSKRPIETLACLLDEAGAVPVYDAETVIRCCLDALVATQCAPDMFAVQLESGELDRRWKAIGPAFDPHGRVVAAIAARNWLRTTGTYRVHENLAGEEDAKTKGI